MEVLVSLCVGLVIAVVFQLMLTNLGIALGLTVLNFAPKPLRPQPEPAAPPDSPAAAPGNLDAGDAGDAGDPAAADGSLPITHLTGLGFALSLSTVLFVASLCATEFSEITGFRRGIIFGMTLWGVYWLLFIWLSSTTLSGIAASLLGTAIASGKKLVTAVRQAFDGTPRDPADVDQDLRQALAEQISQMADIQEYLPILLTKQRQELLRDLSDRTSLSEAETASILATVEPSESPESESPESASPEFPLPGGLEQASSSSALRDAADYLLSQLNLPNWQQVLEEVLTRIDLSDIDLLDLNPQQLVQQVQAFMTRSDAGSQDDADALAIPLDAEDYVRHTPLWALQPELIEADFYERLYDPEAAAAEIQEQLATLNRDRYVSWLRDRQDLARDRLETIADQLSAVQAAVQDTVQGMLSPESTAGESTAGESAATALDQQHWPEVHDKLVAYCRYTNLDVLTPEKLTEKVQTLQQEFELSPQVLGDRLSHTMDVYAEILSRRQGIDPDQQQELMHALAIAKPQDKDSPLARLSPDRLSQQLQSYFERIDWSQVTVDDLKPELLKQLQRVASVDQIDWQAIAQDLPLPTAQKHDLLDWLQASYTQMRRKPRRWIDRVSRSAQSFSHQVNRYIKQYLRFQDKTALQATQIATDIGHIVKMSIKFLPSLSVLSNVTKLYKIIDFEGIRQGLSDRYDLTTDEVQQILSWIETGWQQVIDQMSTLPQDIYAKAQELIETEADALHSIRQQIVDQVSDLQEFLQTQAATTKANIQAQVDAIRRQLAIAAWWLFLSFLASGGSAAIASWLAVKY